jgi:hypothetical protein
MSESSFGSNAGVQGQEPSYEADVAAGYDEDDDVPFSDVNAGDATDNSSAADVDAGYDDELADDPSDD